jgi:hypothetical protein
MIYEKDSESGFLFSDAASFNRTTSSKALGIILIIKNPLAIIYIILSGFHACLMNTSILLTKRYQINSRPVFS